MHQPAPTDESRSVLVHAPRGRDADVVRQVLQAQQLDSHICPTLADLVASIRAGADLAFVTEESLLGAELGALKSWIDAQPPWSDFPFIVLATRRTGRRPNAAAEVLRSLGNVVLLERPLDVDTLVSAARAAMRARARQYETQRHLIAQERSRQAERDAVAEALRAKQALEVAIEAGELGTFHCPFPLGPIFWNDRCTEHFWLPPGTQIDLDLFYSRVHPDEREATRAAIQAAVDGADYYDVEYRTVAPDGRFRWLRAKGRVYRTPTGEPTRFDGVTIDISRQKRLEDEREALLAAEHEARLDAERAGRMKDEFLATLSHELRTPLSAILGWTYLLGRPEAKPQDVAKAAATIDRNARAQARLIEDLLDVSRITSGNLQLDPRPVAVAALFDTVMQSLSPEAEAKNITITATATPDALSVLADVDRMQQVVRNLVSNAIKFTPAGGSVALHAHAERNEVVIRVSDDGAGIPADFLPFVFERFRQADATSTRSYGGLGLGLAIVRQLVEAHGGSVHAASDGPDKGATFTIRLPATIAPRPDAGTAQPPEDAQARDAETGEVLSGWHILVVDDETDGREMLSTVLQMRGARVTAAASADEALAILDGQSPDLMISDIGMPRVDGYELMRRVRERERLGESNLPAIALTAFARTEDAVKARAAGFRAHLAKPVEPSQLVTAIMGMR